ncbi:GPI mannosyltransferase 1 [Diplogelasinospora grovesii]|uniref:GPI mannosyltransferase 1 n=1 Tax=Diplogelasinospora grovesii TaxID=303347 RepID=A0AAN6NA29_9PEZI|nr:GPI mannosyltransferase 1 [Diplogelasinospora grovesii]
MAKRSTESRPSAEGRPSEKSTVSISASPSSSFLNSFFSTPTPLYLSAAALRIILLVYGLWQDANSPVKYTDIDYLVFTDAARFVSRGKSPYARETYRYTPLLAWLLLPTTWRTNPTSHVLDTALFSSGKVMFAVADLVAGWLIERVLITHSRMDAATARKYAAIWLLNPMVATISTRGSSEGLLGVLVMALLWAVLSRKITLAGLLLGFGVHFKIYPFIYAPSIVWWLDHHSTAGLAGKSLAGRMRGFVTPARLRLAVVSLATFIALNVVMFYLYGGPFLVHTYFHHVTRIDHRHNFSPYNIQLYLASAFPTQSGLRIESVAFLPQLLLSCVLIPLVMAKKDLPTAMLAQTFAFVAFNKVCTSQYFLWYMVFLPLYLPRSSFLRNKTLGMSALVLWVVSQGLWLQQGYELEFLGRSTFLPGLWLTSLGFFLVNCWILGIIISDVGAPSSKL